MYLLLESFRCDEGACVIAVVSRYYYAICLERYNEIKNVYTRDNQIVFLSIWGW